MTSTALLSKSSKILYFFRTAVMIDIWTIFLKPIIHLVRFYAFCEVWNKIFSSLVSPSIIIIHSISVVFEVWIRKWWTMHRLQASFSKKGWKRDLLSAPSIMKTEKQLCPLLVSLPSLIWNAFPHLFRIHIAHDIPLCFPPKTPLVEVPTCSLSFRSRKYFQSSCSYAPFCNYFLHISAISV